MTQARLDITNSLAELALKAEANDMDAVFIILEVSRFAIGWGGSKTTRFAAEIHRLAIGDGILVVDRVEKLK